MAEHISVQVVYALKDVQEFISLTVPDGTTVKDAIGRSGLLDKYPQIDLTRDKVGIFGKLGKLDAPLRDRDRIEIYRPLIADPKEVRKRRAEEGKVMKKGGGPAE